MNAPETLGRELADGRRWSWLPVSDTWKYHVLLFFVGTLVLGPLGGVTASYMNFSIGFFVGGQVLAGILGSTITYGYGIQGKHGANYIQTTAASVAGLSGLGVVIQAMVWLGLPQPPMLHLVLYFLCIGMFGAGVGMLYTPILVDKMRLTYPSGLAVANILRALTDKNLLRRSVAKLGGGGALGLGLGIAADKIAFLGRYDINMSTLGAGMIVGARIGIPALMAGLIFSALVPYFVSIGWLHEGDPFRKISFLISLGMILGAAVVDVSLITYRAWMNLMHPELREKGPEPEDWKRTNTTRLVAWVGFWAICIVLVGHYLLDAPVFYLVFAIALVFVFMIVNGISQGISDSNPISSAFVVSVVLMASIGLRQPIVGLIAASVLLISTSVGCDMQQDRSTGWRLGTNRIIQFRYQVGGILVGAVMAVVFAQLFMAAYPALLKDQTVLSADQQDHRWNAAMTYKFVGALRSLTDDKPYQRTAIWLGLGIGLLLEGVRKALKSRRAYQDFVKRSRTGFAIDFVLDAFFLPSTYAFTFGGFVNIWTSGYFAAGGVISSAMSTVENRSGKVRDKDIPEDMSTASLVGGGMIAGDALAALGLGVAGLVGTLIAS